VFFTDPALIDDTEQAQFLAINKENLQLPAELESDAPVLGHWMIFAESERRYLAARAAFIKEHGAQIMPRGARLIWDGNGEQGRANPNAALTVFRHFDSASVEQGLIGEKPQTAWIISYPLLERLHYLLVAGYDVYGNLGHQLRSRLYMDFLRIEGEQNFLSLLPEDAHSALEQHWYRDAPRWTLDYVAASHVPPGGRRDPELAGLPADQAYVKLLATLRQRVGRALANRFDLQNIPSGALREALEKLEGVSGKSLQWLPQTVLIRVTPRQGRPVWLTLLNNSAHKNVAEIFFEDRRRLPDEDTLTVANGFIGAYPNAFWTVDETDLPELTRRIVMLTGETDYGALMDRFGVRRTNHGFWPLSDEAHFAMKELDRVGFGLLDFNRLENR
jgi:fatty acid cis/trans isomerase CTI